jgi:hypothetical protein
LVPGGRPELSRAALFHRALFVLYLGATFASGLTAVADGDLFWHLAAGREMVTTGHLLRADPFTVSALGRPWIDVHWLFQLAAYGGFRLGGLLALVLLKSALLAAGAAVLWAVVARQAPALRLPLALALPAALFLARHLVAVRPIVLTLLLLALFFAALESPVARRLRWLPLLQIVWVNVQGLSALGPALVAIYLGGALGTRWLGGRRWYPFEREPRPVRPLLLALLGCLAASLVSPFGARAALLPLKLFLRITPAGANVFASQVAENVPPFLLERTAAAQIGHFKWYLAALALTFAVGRQRLRLSRLLLVAALVTLALMANRNVLLLYWLATPIAVMNLAPAVEWIAAHRFARAIAAITTMATAALAGLAAVAAAREPDLRAPTPFRFPTESARHIAARPGRGTVFAPDHQGGYLSWTLHPRYRPYLDTRLILHTADEFRAYLELLDHPERFADFEAAHHFDYAVLPTGYPDRYLGLVAELARSPEWRLTFTDGAEVLFAHRTDQPAVYPGDGATTDAVLASLDQRYQGTLRTAARLNLAKLDLVLGHLDQAQRVLAPMTDRGARALRARAYLLGHDLVTAEALARSLVVDDPGDVGSMTLLARIAFARGDSAGGVAWLRRALDRDPFDAEVRALVDRLDNR